MHIENKMDKTFLLVEDNPVSVEYIRALLENGSKSEMDSREKSTILVAQNLKEGMDIISRENIDIILLDLTLPDSKGISSFSKIHEHNDRIPIIVLTGEDDTELAFEAVRQGAQDYLVKDTINKTLLLRSIYYALERMSILKALLDSEERYSIALKATNDGIWEWNLREHFLYYSPRWKEIIGFADETLTNEPSEWFERIHPDDVLAVEGVIASHLAGETENLVTEHRLLHKNGTYIWVRVHGLAVLDKDGSVRKIAGSLTDITGEKFIDSLTGLPSISLFSDRLQSNMERMNYEKNYSFVLVKFEFEQFKLITNTYGAAATNQVLQKIVARIRESLKTTDTMGRLDGFSFGIILPGVHEIFELNAILDNIQTVASKPLQFEDHQISVSLGFGILFANLHYKKPEEMLRDVESALQIAMKDGRSNREVYESEMRDRSLKVLRMEADMRRALERDEFFLAFQPILCLKTNKIKSTEALIRWVRNDGSILGPGHFIPIAEESDMIIRIGAWVIEEAILQLQRWQKAGITDVSISINLSARQFLNWNMVNYIKKTIQLAKIPENLLEVEVTESAAMKDIDLSKQILENLHKAGISVALDDFGTGYSSLSYLKQFPISKLKLDQSFAKDLPKDKESAAIVSALIALGQAMDLKVVIEGIEEKEQMDFIKLQKADFIQGYIVGKPVPSNEIIEFITKYNK